MSLRTHEHIDEHDVLGLARGLLVEAHLDGHEAPPPRWVVRCLHFTLDYFDRNDHRPRPCGWFDLRRMVFMLKPDEDEVEENGPLVHEIGHCGGEIIGGTPTFVQDEEIAWEVGCEVVMPREWFWPLLQRSAEWNAERRCYELAEAIFAKYPHVPRWLVIRHARKLLGEPVRERLLPPQKSRGIRHSVVTWQFLS
jgi:hypothetical protein